MAQDLSLEVREAAVVAMKASAGLLALVPGDRIFGISNPPDTTYPFVRYGMPVTGRLPGACLNGSSEGVTIHVFANGPSENEAAAIAKQIVAALDQQSFRVDPVDPDSVTVTFHWTGGQTMSDASEPDVVHIFRTFEADAVG